MFSDITTVRRECAAIKRNIVTAYRQHDASGIGNEFDKLAVLCDNLELDIDYHGALVAVAHGLAALAQMCNDRAQFADALTLLEICFANLHETSILRPTSPAGREHELYRCNQAMLLAIAALAEAKWKSLRVSPDDVMPLACMLGAYRRIQDDMHLFFMHNPGRDYEGQNALLLDCGIALVAAYYRWQSEQADRVVSLIENYHGHVLRSRRQPYYWQVRIVRLLGLGALSPDELMACNERRLAAAAQVYGTDIAAYTQAVHAEQQFIIQQQCRLTRLSVATCPTESPKQRAQ